MDVLIFSGQSNMQGSTGSTPTEPAVENCIEYKYLTNEFVKVAHPVGEDIGDDLLSRSAFDYGSLVPSFCREYSKYNGDCCAIHVARGNTLIKEWLKGTARYDALVEKCKRGIEKLKEREKVDNVYFIWLQGESDALIRTSKENYQKMLIDFKNDLKKDIGINKFGIIIVGYFCAYASWIKRPFEEKLKDDETIINAQKELPGVDDDFVALTDICTKLSLQKEYLNDKELAPHYNNEGMIIIGTEAGKALAKLVK